MSLTDNISPLVSVYMPTKNRLALLQLAIESVFSQDHSAIELLIVNDGSTDGTKAYLDALSKEHSNIIVFHNEQSIGACAARNIAIKHAKGEFVTGLDDDDLFTTVRISSLLKAYDDNYAFVCSSMWWDYGNKKRLIDNIEGEITLVQQLSYNEATTQVLVKKERVLAVGGFDESFVACQDYDLWTRLMIKYGSAYRLNEPSYIINDTATTVRMIGNPKSVQGYEQYYQKHSHLMSNNNKKNQQFMKLRRLRQPMSLTMLLSQMGSGHVWSKFRYFLSSNFQLIKNLHYWFYKK